MIAEIRLVCDNPGHARGKKATLAVYMRISGKWERHGPYRKTALRTRRRSAQRRDRRLADAQASGATPFEQIKALSGDPRQGQPRCKLCGATLVGWPDPRWAEPRWPELERLAAKDQAEVTVTELNRLRLRPKVVGEPQHWGPPSHPD